MSDPTFNVGDVPAHGVAEGSETVRRFDAEHLQGSGGEFAAHYMMQQAEAGCVEDIESERVRGAQLAGGPKWQSGAQAAIHVAPVCNFDWREGEGDGAAGGQVLPCDLAIPDDVAAEEWKLHGGECEGYTWVEALEQLAGFSVKRLRLEESRGM